MPEDPKRIKLRLLMAEYELKCPDVAEILDRSENTVRGWCATTGDDIPDHSLELLELRLKCEQ